MPRHPLRAGDIAHGINQEFLATLLPGYPVPSIRELANHYGVNKDTIQRAFDILVAQGHIESHGTGRVYRVRDRRIRSVLMTASAQFSDPTAPLTPLPITKSAPVIEHHVPELEIAELLRLRRDEPILVHSQQYLINDRPTGAVISYISPDVATAVPHLDTTDADNLIMTLEAACLVIVEMSDTTSARMPTTDEVIQWRVPAEIPVITHHRVTWDNHGEALYVTVTILPADLYRIKHHLPREIAPRTENRK